MEPYNIVHIVKFINNIKKLPTLPPCFADKSFAIGELRNGNFISFWDALDFTWRSINDSSAAIRKHFSFLNFLSKISLSSSN